MTTRRERDPWFKSSWSPDKADCVEVNLGGAVGVRDTKDREGGELALPVAAWVAFLDGLK
jgi:hypothetical protein